MPGFPLRNAEQAGEVAAFWWLGGLWDAAIVVGLFGEENDEDEAEGGLIDGGLVFLRL